MHERGGEGGMTIQAVYSLIQKVIQKIQNA